MIRDLDKPCKECGKTMAFDGVAKTITGRYDKKGYERAWWKCEDSECKEYLMGQVFYVGEYKHGERYEFE